MDAATEQGTADRIEVTWASTPKRERLGKIWTSTGEWPVTDGVKRRAYVFQPTRYPNLEGFSVDLKARMLAGVSATVAGRLKLLSRTIDRDEAYPRNAKNIADLASWLLVLDFDGLASTKAGARLDRPEDFGDAVLAEIRKRLPPAFKAVDCLLVATARPACRSTPKASRPTGAHVSAPYFCCRALCSSPSRNKS